MWETNYLLEPFLELLTARLANGVVLDVDEKPPVYYRYDASRLVIALASGVWRYDQRPRLYTQNTVAINKTGSKLVKLPYDYISLIIRLQHSTQIRHQNTCYLSPTIYN